MFDFVVRYLGWLKHLPLTALVFDVMLKMWQMLTQPEMLDWIDELEAEFLRWDDASTSIHKYGGLQFNFAGKELGHLHSNGLLDMLFSNELKAGLLREGRVKPHHIFKKSGWISFYIRDIGDKDYALKLLRMAYLRRML